MLGIQGINHLVINISARNDVARVRLDMDWEEKFEVVNAFRNKTREARMPVYWRTYT